MKPSLSHLPESDLALDRHRAAPDQKGVFYREARFGGVLFSALTVKREGAQLGKPCGRYLSLGFAPPALWSEEEKEEITLALRLALLAFFDAPKRVLVAGLGNRRLTADSLGPRVAERVSATASLPSRLLAGFGAAPEVAVAVSVPDVFARTGIESVRTVEAACALSGAQALLALDALATSARERLLRTVEITDTGTVPGGGVKRGKEALTRERLGIPTVALGVPTVVRMDEEHFLVPRDLEEGVDALAEVLSRAIDLAFGEAPPSVDFRVESLFSSANM